MIYQQLPMAIRLAPAKTHQEWLTRKRESIGGTDATTILGTNPYQTVTELFTEKTTGQPPEQDPAPFNPHMAFGHHAEGLLDYITHNTTEATTYAKPGMYRNTTRRWQTGNPDALAHHGTTLGVAEYKTTPDDSEEAAGYAQGLPAARALIQVMHYLAVTGLPFAYITAGLTSTTSGWQHKPSSQWAPADIVTSAHTIGPIERDAELIHQIITAEATFNDCLERGTLDVNFPPMLLPDTHYPVTTSYPAAWK